MEVVLERCTRQQQAVLEIELFDVLVKLALFVFHFMRLIDDEVLEMELIKLKLADLEALVGGDENIEVLFLDDSVEHILSFLFRGLEYFALAAWHPVFEFLLPVEKCTFWDNNQMRTFILEGG